MLRFTFKGNTKKPVSDTGVRCGGVKRDPGKAAQFAVKWLYYVPFRHRGRICNLHTKKGFRSSSCEVTVLTAAPSCQVN